MGMEELLKPSAGPGGVTGEKTSVPMPFVIFGALCLFAFFLFAGTQGIFTKDYVAARPLTKKEISQAARKQARAEKKRDTFTGSMQAAKRKSN